MRVNDHRLGSRALTMAGSALAYAVATFSGLGCTPPAVVDVPPASLSAKVAVIDPDPSPGDNKVIVAVQFFSGGDYVRLASGIAVTCNGTPLTDNPLGYMNRVPIQPVGGQYLLDYTRNGVTSPITSVTVPPRPAILSPSQGAQIPRGPNITITYVPGTGDHVTGSVGGQRAGSGSVSASGNNQPDDGTYDGLDASSFDAGAGRVSLTRVLKTAPAGSPFSSVEVTYNTGNKRTVTWQ